MSNIPEEGLNFRFSKDRGWLQNAMPDMAEPLGCSRDVHVSLQAKRLAENVFLEGAIVTGLELICCRCLEAATLPVDALFRYTLVPMPDRQDPEIELGSEDLEYGYYDEDTIDLEPMILEQIILQIPIRVLCREDCRGLCPRCGANLNQEPCRCQSEVIDERFALLKNLKIEKQQ